MAQKSIIASVATVVCVVVFVFLLGGTVAVALIPLYTANRAVAASASEFPLSLSLFEFECWLIRFLCSDALSSKEVTLIVDVEANNTETVGRRKRAVGDLYEYVGSEFGPTGRDMMAETVCNQSLLN